MNIDIKTERSKKLLEKTNLDLVNAINSLIDDQHIQDVDYLEDVFAIHKFILDYELATEGDKVCHHGLNVLVYKTVYPTVIDFGKPIAKQIEVEDFDTFVAVKYIQTKISASNRGIEFKLSLSQMAKILKRKTCFYTGVELDDVHSLSLDRKDNKLGYVEGNVVACSKLVNNLKEQIIESKRVTDSMTDKQIIKMLQSFCKLVAN